MYTSSELRLLIQKLLKTYQILYINQETSETVQLKQLAKEPLFK